MGALQDTLRTVCVPLGRRGFAEPNALSLGPEKLPLRPPSRLRGTAWLNGREAPSSRESLAEEAESILS